MKKRHLLVVAGLGLLTMAAVACSNSSTPPMSTSAAGPTSTTSASTGTYLPGSATSTAVWPTSSSATRYGSPEAAATGFATGFLHMTSPLIGSLRSGDARSGEIAVRPGSAGPVTTVLVRRLGSDDSWWVLGAATDAIRLTAPVWNASIASPVILTGTSTAFEGTVQTQVRNDDATILGSGSVAGGSTSSGPFSGTLAFTRPTSGYGSVVLYTISAETGSVREASVLRVRFG